ncbi:MAG TPA: hypothetical protein VF857_03265, partial [Spirochaetota bacterium]
SADYRLVYNDAKSGRGVYSFCMCPGGEVINSSSENNLLCVNGMSYSARNSSFSNAAIVVTVNPKDFSEGDDLSGIEFQRDLERKAFFLGGENFRAPAQKASDFVRQKDVRESLRTSYMPDISSCDLSSIFPAFMKSALIKGLHRFDQIIPGFIEHGVCIGVESRTSSPVRILRAESMESVSMKRLYPIGEGAGYAGGIVSSAVDGVKCADMIISQLTS